MSDDHNEQNLDGSLDPSHDTNTVPGGVSGRMLTGIILALLILLGGGLSYTLWSYNRLDQQRAVANELWLDLASELSTRYRGIEKEVADRVDERTMEMEIGEEFRLAVDRFRTTAQPNLQLEAAREIEGLLTDMPWVGKPSESLLDVTNRYNDQLSQVREVVGSTGGQVLSLFLTFPSYAPLQLAGDNK